VFMAGSLDNAHDARKRYYDRAIQSQHFDHDVRFLVDALVGETDHPSVHQVFRMQFCEQLLRRRDKYVPQLEAHPSVPQMREVVHPAPFPLSAGAQQKVCQAHKLQA
jgi:hypothetical protein